MPFTLRMESDLFVVEMSGAITTRDFIRLAEEVLAFERTQQTTPNRLTDISRVTHLAVNYAEIERVAHLRRASLPANPIRSAVFASTPMQFGMARMFQSLNNHPGVTVEVFRDLPSALAWLRESDSSST